MISNSFSRLQPIVFKKMFSLKMSHFQGNIFHLKKKKKKKVAGFFPDAANLFKEHVDTNGMSFKVLDIEKEPKDQGFVEGKYDLRSESTRLNSSHDVISRMPSSA